MDQEPIEMPEADSDSERLINQLNWIGIGHMAVAALCTVPAVIESVSDVDTGLPTLSIVLFGVGISMGGTAKFIYASRIKRSLE